MSLHRLLLVLTVVAATSVGQFYHPSYSGGYQYTQYQSPGSPYSPYYGAYQYQPQVYAAQQQPPPPPPPPPPPYPYHYPELLQHHQAVGEIVHHLSGKRFFGTVVPGLVPAASEGGEGGDANGDLVTRDEVVDLNVELESDALAALPPPPPPDLLPVLPNDPRLYPDPRYPIHYNIFSPPLNSALQGGGGGGGGGGVQGVTTQGDLEESELDNPTLEEVEIVEEPFMDGTISIPPLSSDKDPESERLVLNNQYKSQVNFLSGDVRNVNDNVFHTEEPPLSLVDVERSVEDVVDDERDTADGEHPTGNSGSVSRPKSTPLKNTIEIGLMRHGFEGLVSKKMEMINTKTKMPRVGRLIMIGTDAASATSGVAVTGTAAMVTADATVPADAAVSAGAAVPPDATVPAAAPVPTGATPDRDSAIDAVPEDDGMKQWPYLNATWRPIGSGQPGFFALPRTMAKAEAQGWVKLSSCDEESKSRFPGNRYLQSATDDNVDDIVLIFDLNGFVAGVQSLVPESQTNNDMFYPFKASPFYQKEPVLGRQVFFSTVFFMEPSLICTLGRTSDQFERQGTGYALYLQSGPTPDNRISVPVTEAGALNDDTWYEHQCGATTGKHYLRHPFGDFHICTRTNPFSVMYNKGRINGFAFRHIAPLTGDRWETETSASLGRTLKQVPSCFSILTGDPGIKTMHFFLDDNIAKDCIDNL